MKNKINGFSVKFMAGMLIVGFGLAFSTPSSAQAPAWTVSKDVQKVANKKQFEDQKLNNSHIQVTSVNQNWANAKGVNTIGSENIVAKGNIRSNGTPEWINSKGVHGILHGTRERLFPR